MALTSLWLEKYKPKKYYELLTDERINREIQTWVKSWDEITYNKKINKIFTNDYTNSYLTNSNKALNKNSEEINNTTTKNLNYYNKYLEDLNYKKYKYIIISGPPGTGKTTLAEIISSICGYNPCVVNASDERSASLILHKLDNATKNNNLSYFNNNTKKPTLLILDEIDGINFNANSSNESNNVGKQILEFIKSGGASYSSNKNKIKKNIFNNKKDKNKTTNKYTKSDNTYDHVFYNSESDDENIISNNYNDKSIYDNKIKNKEKNINNFILRPIICICNDLYAKSLTHLRKDALVFNVKKANNDRLLERLSIINKKEMLFLSELDLKNLIDKTNGDIRRCLNLMQFLSYNKSPSNTVNNTLITNLGCKEKSIGFNDINQSYFSVWNKLLFNSNVNNLLDYKLLENEYKSCESHETVADGIFVNYLNSPFFNKYDNYSIINSTSKLYKEKILNNLKDISDISDLLSFANRSSKIIDKEDKDYILPGYKLIECINKYSISLEDNNKFKDENYNLIEFPNLFKNMYFSSNNNKKILTLLTNNFYLESNISSSYCYFLMNILPYIAHIIIPDVNNYSLDLMNSKEKNYLFLSSILAIKLDINFKINEDSIEVYPNIFKFLYYESNNLIENNKDNALEIHFSEKSKHNLEGKYLEYDVELDYNSYFKKIITLKSEVNKISVTRTSLKFSNISKEEYNILKDEYSTYYSTNSNNIRFKEENYNEANNISSSMVLDSNIESKKKQFNMFYCKKKSIKDLTNKDKFEIKFNDGNGMGVKRPCLITMFIKKKY